MKLKPGCWVQVQRELRRWFCPSQAFFKSDAHLQYLTFHCPHVEPALRFYTIKTGCLLQTRHKSQHRHHLWHRQHSQDSVITCSTKLWFYVPCLPAQPTARSVPRTAATSEVTVPFLRVSTTGMSCSVKTTRVSRIEGGFVLEFQGQLWSTHNTDDLCM